MAVATALGLTIAIAGAGVLLALGAAVLVLRVPRKQNRILAVVLGVEALALAGFGVAAVRTLARLGEPYTNPSEWSQDLSILVPASLVSAYLFFISTLGTPLVRWLRSRVATLALLAYPFLVFVLKLSYVEDFAAEPDARDLLSFFGVIGALIAANVFCLVAAIDAWRRASPGTAQRDRAKAFALAFGTRDAMLALTLVAWYTLGFGPESPVSAFAWDWIATVGVPLSFLVYLVLLAHGILRTQLFDIDVRVRKGLAATLVMGFFVTAFFVAEQAGQALISERAGTAAGLAGAGAMALAFVPLRRAAERVARRAVPADTSEASLRARKAQVYGNAVESAMEDGMVTPKERAILTRLGADLGLEPREMARIEDEVAAQRAAIPTPTVGEHATV